MNISKIDYKILDPDYPLLVLFLNGKEESQTLESFAFIKSTESNGLFPILNCTCGEWGCGGFWAQVRQEGDFVIWEKIRIWEKDKDITTLHVKTPIIFEKNDYQKVANKMLERIESNESLKRTYEAEKKDYEKTGKFYWAGFSAPEPNPTGTRMKKLNGLPHNLTQSFFSTLRYFQSGYMEDWIFYAAKISKIKLVRLDIISSTVIPKEFNFSALVTNLKSLKKMMGREINIIGLPDDFIKEAKITITIPDFKEKLIFAKTKLVDKAGIMYETKSLPFGSGSIEPEFDPFAEDAKYQARGSKGMLNKIRKLFNPK
jgi:hypothetical protein